MSTNSKAQHLGGNLSIDPESGGLYLEDELLNMKPQSASILKALYEGMRADEARYIPTDTIRDQAWPADTKNKTINASNVNTAVYVLRRLLESYGLNHIISIDGKRGWGYRLICHHALPLDAYRNDPQATEKGIPKRALAKYEVSTNTFPSSDKFSETFTTDLQTRDAGSAVLETNRIPTARESLASAVRHPNRETARALLQALIKQKCDDSESAIAQIYAFSTLATLEDKPARRLDIRRNALKRANNVWRQFSTSGVAIALADASVDCFYDRFADEDPDRRDLMLREAKKSIDKALTFENGPHEQAALLSQKASLLGCQALVAGSKDRDTRLNTRLACARKAVQLDETNCSALIALGNAEWMSARWTKDHGRRASRLNEAESAFRRSISRDPISRLILSRFWRLTYRPLRALESFRAYANLEHDIWRRRSESHLAGEAVVLFQLQGYPSVVVRSAAQFAHSFLQDAISSGVATARTYIAMANVLQLLGMSTDADVILRGLRRAKGGGWMEVLSEAIRALKEDRSSEVDSAFVLGLSESTVWNQFGSYVRRYTNDVALARACWETGLHLRENDPELLTNMARSLAPSHDPADVVQASAYVGRAAYVAEQTWPWWRPVRKEIEEARKRLGLAPLPRLSNVDQGWEKLENSLDELRERRIDAITMLQVLSDYSYGIQLSHGFIETGELLLEVEPREDEVVLRGGDDNTLEIGFKHFDEIVNGRIILSALIEREMSTLLRSPPALYSDS